MRILYERVGGVDVHKKSVVACRMRVTEEKRIEWEVKTFGTTTAELLKLYDWLSSAGKYSRLLEASFQHPGRWVRGSVSQCPTSEEGAGTQDRCQ